MKRGGFRAPGYTRDTHEHDVTVLESKSITTKSMSKNFRQTFLKGKYEYEKLKLRIFKDYCTTNSLQGIIQRIRTTKPASSDPPSEKLDKPSPTRPMGELDQSFSIRH